MNIFELQAGLLQLGFNPGRVDGVWGTKTEQAAKAAQKKFAKNSKVEPAQLPVLVEQILYKVIGGLATGPLDGIHGPATKSAATHWERGPWRNALMQKLPGDRRMPYAVKRWPTYAELRTFYGEPGAGLVEFHFPYPVRLSWNPNVTVHKTRAHWKVADSLLTVMNRIRDEYSASQRQKLGIDLFGGCYDARVMRGGTKLSTHAWGIALDWDPVRNPLRWGRDRAEFAKPAYEAFWDAWTAEGWLSLGKARNFDWMHVQAARL